MSELQRSLCDMVQAGLPVCRRPFERIAETLGVDSQSVSREIRELKGRGVIRRFSVMIDYRALGRVSTLVTSHVPKAILDDAVAAVNGLSGVSHNYLRDHHYNLWFTLQAETIEKIDNILSELSMRFGTEFHSLPAEQAFKLDVRFDISKCGRDALKNELPVKTEAAVLNDMQKTVLIKLQEPLEPVERPFDLLASEDMPVERVLQIIQELFDMGVIRRIAAVLDHRKLGFMANVLFAASVPVERIVDVGTALAGSQMVTHCYQRKTFRDWPYNLFAMMHGRSSEEINAAVKDFTKSQQIESFILLPTVAELKKQPVRITF